MRMITNISLLIVAQLYVAALLVSYEVPGLLMLILFSVVSSGFLQPKKEEVELRRLAP